MLRLHLPVLFFCKDLIQFGLSRRHGVLKHGDDPIILRLKQQLMATERANFPMMTQPQRVALSRTLAANWERAHGPENAGTRNHARYLPLSLAITSGVSSGLYSHSQSIACVVSLSSI